MLIHASAYRFGIAIDLIIEAIGAAFMENETPIGLDHFAEAYYIKANCDDKLNPFINPLWKAIDTSRVFDPEYEEGEPRKKRRRKA